MAAGYLLGRFKKLRLALVVGSALASEDVRSRGATLLLRGPVGLAQPVAGSLSRQLVQAGKGAALGAAGSRIGGLSDRINARTQSLRGEEPEDADEYDEEEPEDEPVDDEYDDEEEGDSEEFEDESDEDEPEDESDELEDEPEDIPQQRSSRRSRAAAPVGR